MHKRLRQKLVHCQGGVFFALHRHMCVDVQRGGRHLMAKELLHLLNSVTAVNQQTPRCMAEIMKATLCKYRF